MRGDTSPEDEGIQARLRALFEQARSDPRLIQGTVISDADVNCDERKARFPAKNLEMNFRPFNKDYGTFAFSSSTCLMDGRVDLIYSADRRERIFILRDISVLRGSLDRDQFVEMANLVATINEKCANDLMLTITSLILFDGEAADG